VGGVGMSWLCSNQRKDPVSGSHNEGGKATEAFFGEESMNENKDEKTQVPKKGTLLSAGKWDLLKLTGKFSGM